MLPVQDRNDSRNLAVWAAPETMETIYGRIKNLFESGRVMTMVEFDDSPGDRILMTNSLTLDYMVDDPIRFHPADELNGPSIVVLLSRGARFAVSSEPDDTEATAYWRFLSRDRSPVNVSMLEFDGGRDDDYGYDDQVRLTRYNDYGVKITTLVGFARVD